MPIVADRIDRLEPKALGPTPGPVDLRFMTETPLGEVRARLEAP